MLWSVLGICLIRKEQFPNWQILPTNSEYLQCSSMKCFCCVNTKLCLSLEVVSSLKALARVYQSSLLKYQVMIWGGGGKSKDHLAWHCQNSFHYNEILRLSFKNTLINFNFPHPFCLLPCLHLWECVCVSVVLIFHNCFTVSLLKSWRPHIEEHWV